MAVTLPRLSNQADRELMSRAQDILGDVLVMAVAVGSWPDKLTAKQTSEAMEHTDGVLRLREALNVAELLLQEEAASTVRAWFAGKNPMLDDQAPAIVLATDPEAVRRAARDFLAHG